jgi:Periplasmic binding protein
MLVVLVLLAACQDAGSQRAFPLRTPLSTPTSPQGPNIGLVASMSGTQAWRGEDAYRGADLAVHVLNRGLPGDQPPYELVALDDGGVAERAVELVRRLVGSGNTVGVVYAGPPQAASKVERALAAAGIPLLVCYGDLYGARRLTPHVFQMAPPALWEGRRIAKYLIDDRRYEAVGAVVEGSVMGRIAARAVRDSTREEGGRWVGTLAYDPAAEPAAVLDRMRRRQPEALVVQGSPVSISAIVDGLRDMGAAYAGSPAARIASARRRVRTARRRGGWWAPHVAALDMAITSRLDARPFPGTVAADSYARGAHYLPVPSFEGFRRVFRRWWDALPLGWELRAYEATRLIGWAAEEAAAGEDLAVALEGLRDRRFGGADITFGPDDHTAAEQASVGLWVVPAPGDRVPERRRIPRSLPWVPLARGFSIDGDTTDLPARDWRYLFRNAPPPGARAPKVEKMRFGIATPRSDPLH